MRKDFIQILTKLLQKRRYQVDDVSYNGLEALQLVRKNTYDAIIMDVMMPEMNGYKAVEEIGFENYYTNYANVKETVY